MGMKKPNQVPLVTGRKKPNQVPLVMGRKKPNQVPLVMDPYHNQQEGEHLNDSMESVPSERGQKEVDEMPLIIPENRGPEQQGLPMQRSPAVSMSGSRFGVEETEVEASSSANDLEASKTVEKEKKRKRKDHCSWSDDEKDALWEAHQARCSEKNKKNLYRGDWEDIALEGERNDKMAVDAQEQRFLHYLTKLFKEDAELSMHLKKLNEINRDYQDKLVALEIEQGKMREEFLRNGSQSQFQQYQQLQNTNSMAQFQNIPSPRLPSGIHHSHPSAGGYNMELYPGGYSGETAPRAPYPSQAGHYVSGGFPHGHGLEPRYPGSYSGETAPRAPYPSQAGHYVSGGFPHGHELEPRYPGGYSGEAAPRAPYPSQAGHYVSGGYPHAHGSVSRYPGVYSGETAPRAPYPSQAGRYESGGFPNVHGLEPRYPGSRDYNAGSRQH